MTEAMVNLQTIPPAAAQKQMRSPLETSWNGEIKSMTLTIPLLSGPNAYLVVKLPVDAVKALVEKVKTLPAEQREDFVREWLASNQKAALEKYVAGGRKGKQFLFETIPVKSNVFVVPSRTAPANSAVPVLSGTRSIPANPSTITTPPLRERTLIMPERPKPPVELKGGSGTAQKPYIIVAPGGATPRYADKRYTSSFSIKVALTDGGSYDAKFLVTFNTSDIRDAAKTSQTANKLKFDIAKTLDYVSKDKGLAFENSSLRDALAKVEAKFIELAQPLTNPNNPNNVWQ